MSAINTQLQPHIQHSGYYQLNQTAGGQTGGATRTSASALRAAGVNAVSQATNFSDAVLVDLSPEAQKYLSGLAKQPAISEGFTGNDTFVLSSQQRLALSSLLEKYKNGPYTQETFDAIQDDLQKAGLSPQTLSAREKANSFNATAVLVDALNGGRGTTPGSTPISDEALEKKAANYMQEVIGQWKKISSDYQNKQNADAVSAVGGA
jgi:hypothetical protein